MKTISNADVHVLVPGPGTGNPEHACVEGELPSYTTLSANELGKMCDVVFGVLRAAGYGLHARMTLTLSDNGGITLSGGIFAPVGAGLECHNQVGHAIRAALADEGCALARTGISIGVGAALGVYLTPAA